MTATYAIFVCHALFFSLLPVRCIALSFYYYFALPHACSDVQKKTPQPPPKLGIIFEGSESRANSRADSGSDIGGSSSNRKPTPLDPFLASIDEKLLAYGERLVK
jgi:hypothetical protein